MLAYSLRSRATATCATHNSACSPCRTDLSCSRSLLHDYSILFIGTRQSRTNLGSHIDASHSRQPLVKGERLVRYEVNAVMYLSCVRAIFRKIGQVLNSFRMGMQTEMLFRPRYAAFVILCQRSGYHCVCGAQPRLQCTNRALLRCPRFLEGMIYGAVSYTHLRAHET